MPLGLLNIDECDLILSSISRVHIYRDDNGKHEVIHKKKYWFATKKNRIGTFATLQKREKVKKKKLFHKKLVVKSQLIFSNRYLSYTFFCSCCCAVQSISENLAANNKIYQPCYNFFIFLITQLLRNAPYKNIFFAIAVVVVVVVGVARCRPRYKKLQ